MDLVLVIVLTAVMIPLVVFTTGILRIILSIVFLIFLPGYALVAALFPKKDSLDSVERMALSLVLSIAVVGLVGLVLVYTSWGIRACPIAGAFSGLILACSVAALLRRRGLPKEQRFEPRIRLSMPRLGKETAFDKALMCALLLAVLGAIGTITYVIVVPKHVERFSEFYLLSPNSTMEDYTHEAVVGKPVGNTLGIINREHDDVAYTIEVMIDGESVANIGPVQLSNGEKWEDKVSVVPTRVGSGQKVVFLLYKDKGTEPYLTLHIILDVVEEA
ncbi:MAG: DUF1616 domain-containing protein [Dehalococcoidia bacterium]|nr:DUF1616 domain-containing protein [Dehalococcoidia bacterium]